MIDGQRILALIPARGGSKGLPGKNIRPLADKPLIIWSIDHAEDCEYVDCIVVSTDSDEIAAVCGAKSSVTIIKRPDELATDSALVAETIQHSLDFMEAKGESFDIVALLQPTSPLRPHDLISRCVEQLVEENLSSIAAFSELPVSAQRIWTIGDEGPTTILEGNPWLPRQALDKTYQINGLMYVFRAAEFKAQGAPSVLFGRKKAYITEEYPDIDTLEDFTLAERMLNAGFNGAGGLK